MLMGSDMKRKFGQLRLPSFILCPFSLYYPNLCFDPAFARTPERSSPRVLIQIGVL